MPYLSNEDIKNLHAFYTNPTQANYSVLWAVLDVRAQQSKEIDYAMQRMKIDQFRMLIDQEQKKHQEEATHKIELEKKNSVYEKELAEKAEQTAAAKVEAALSKLFQ